MFAVRFPPSREGQLLPLTRNLVALATLLALASTAGAQSAVTPTYWTPTQMAAVEKDVSGPMIAGQAWAPSRNTGAKCVGIGRSLKGGFPGFRCHVSWAIKVSLTTKTGVSPMWVRTA